MTPAKCSHGIPWSETCLHCELVSAKETVKNFGAIVEKALRRIVEIERKIIEKEAQHG